MLYDPNAQFATVSVQSVQGLCVLTMTATSGSLMAMTQFDIVPTYATGIEILVGTIN